MSQPFVGQLTLMGFNFAPQGWALCQGQAVPISENDTLFNLIGTTYGGDGQQTFNLPNLQGRIAIGQGQGPGLTNNYIVGQTGGVETVTLSINQMPQHTHPAACSTNTQSGAIPNNAVPASGQTIYNAGAPAVNFATTTITQAGGSQPHDNLQPFLVLNWCISLFGIFPNQT